MTAIDMKQKNAPEHSLGKGKAVGSIPTGSTTKFPRNHRVISTTKKFGSARPAQNKAKPRTTLRQDSGKVCSALVLALALTACTSATEGPYDITIHSGLGGSVPVARAIYEHYADSGKPVIIDGHLHSADAFFGLALPNKCYTERASFSLHAISYLGLIPSAKHTDRMARKLPEPVEAWFRAQPAYYDWIGWAYLGGEELRQIWPEGVCK